MTEVIGPRCRYCEQPVANPGDACGMCAGSIIAQADEDAARQGKLLDGDVMAQKSARERAKTVLAKLLADMTVGRGSAGDSLDKKIERIIEALNHIAPNARIAVDDAARERVEMTLAGNYPGFPPRHHENMVSTIIAALGYTTVATLTATDCARCGTRSITRDGKCANGCAPAPPPVVELDAEVLRSLIAMVEAHQKSAITLGPMQLNVGLGISTVIDDTEMPGVSVLRIGGDQ